MCCCSSCWAWAVLCSTWCMRCWDRSTRSPRWPSSISSATSSLRETWGVGEPGGQIGAQMDFFSFAFPKKKASNVQCFPSFHFSVMFLKLSVIYEAGRCWALYPGTCLSTIRLSWCCSLLWLTWVCSRQIFTHWAVTEMSNPDHETLYTRIWLVNISSVL